MFETGGQRACEAVRRLGVGPAKCAGRRFSQAECEQGFGLLHGGYDLIAEWHWNSLGDTHGQSRQRRPRQNQNVGLVLLHRAHRKFDQKVLLFSAYLRDFTESDVPGETARRPTVSMSSVMSARVFGLRSRMFIIRPPAC